MAAPQKASAPTAAQQQQQQQQQIPQGNPETPLAVANLLRRSPLLKQRLGIFQSRTADFFRYKRFCRALDSPAYAKKAAQQPDLFPPMPSVAEKEGAAEDPKLAMAHRLLFIQLIRAQIVLPVAKPHSDELSKFDLSPNKDHPHLVPIKQATLTPDEYYVWNYNPRSLWDTLVIVAVVAGILALVCYPLWPLSMRRGSYYLSMAALVFLGCFFAIAIVRLAIWTLSLAVVSAPKSDNALWIFPNLFEDCGILDSFKPLYGFGSVDCYSYIKKQKRIKRKQARKQQLAEQSAEKATAEQEKQ